ncbi:hypothetical protein PROFUN_14295 [Planoprotostelium fungivorum]|uniref:Uncharacterized protein n=1 Tax=Planoprotostelium fungivorum TaxID=1890364 RepID=A0A2P6N0I1_9EUKA|nr:hypothetical protein PROFUN_14295 [Planoprotostelium fungivorum]
MKPVDKNVKEVVSNGYSATVLHNSHEPHSPPSKLPHPPLH